MIQPQSLNQSRVVYANKYLDLCKSFTSFKNLSIVILDFQALVFCRPIPPIKQAYLAETHTDNLFEE